jgi:hypothetical protein
MSKFKKSNQPSKTMPGLQTRKRTAIESMAKGSTKRSKVSHHREDPLALLEGVDDSDERTIQQVTGSSESESDKDASGLVDGPYSTISEDEGDDELEDAVISAPSRRTKKANKAIVNAARGMVKANAHQFKIKKV